MPSFESPIASMFVRKDKSLGDKGESGEGKVMERKGEGFCWVFVYVTNALLFTAA